MKIGASIDAKDLKLSRPLSDLERRLVFYLFQRAGKTNCDPNGINDHPGEINCHPGLRAGIFCHPVELRINLAELVPAFCQSVPHLQEMLVELISLQINYTSQNDFGFFAIVESAAIGDDACQIVLAPHALGQSSLLVLL